MPHLVDTNILLRFVKSDDPAHAEVRAAVTSLLAQQERLYYPQQCRREFWNVSTRAVESNGFGLTVAETITSLADLDEVFTRLPDRPATGPEWDRLVRQYQVIGRAVHDLSLRCS